MPLVDTMSVQKTIINIQWHDFQDNFETIYEQHYSPRFELMLYQMQCRGNSRTQPVTREVHGPTARTPLKAS